MGGLAGGSAVWGVVAARIGVSRALLVASLGLFIGLIATWRFRLVWGEDLQLTPSMHWPEPVVVIDAQPEQGPILVQVEYRIDPQRGEDFLRAMSEMRRIRQRDGAIRWGLFRDSADPQRYVESFVFESWAEHLRQHERVTVEDREVEERVQSFHLGPQPPIVTHFIAEQLPR